MMKCETYPVDRSCETASRQGDFNLSKNNLQHSTELKDAPTQVGQASTEPGEYYKENVISNTGLDLVAWFGIRIAWIWNASHEFGYVSHGFGTRRMSLGMRRMSIKRIIRVPETTFTHVTDNFIHPTGRINHMSGKLTPLMVCNTHVSNTNTYAMVCQAHTRGIHLCFFNFHMPRKPIRAP